MKRAEAKDKSKCSILCKVQYQVMTIFATSICPVNLYKVGYCFFELIMWFSEVARSKAEKLACLSGNRSVDKKIGLNLCSTCSRVSAIPQY